MIGLTDRGFTLLRLRTPETRKAEEISETWPFNEGSSAADCKRQGGVSPVRAKSCDPVLVQPRWSRPASDRLPWTFKHHHAPCCCLQRGCDSNRREQTRYLLCPSGRLDLPGPGPLCVRVGSLVTLEVKSVWVAAQQQSKFVVQMQMMRHGTTTRGAARALRTLSDHHKSILA